MINQDMLTRSILGKLIRRIINLEFKNSTSDWRSIYGKQLGAELLKGQLHSDEKIDSTLQALLPNMSKDMIRKEKVDFYDMSLVNQKLSETNKEAKETITIDLCEHMRHLD